MSWCQFTGNYGVVIDMSLLALFDRIEIDWTNISPGGPVLRYTEILTNFAMLNTRPECALSTKVCRRRLVC